MTNQLLLELDQQYQQRLRELWGWYACESKRITGESCDPPIIPYERPTLTIAPNMPLETLGLSVRVQQALKRHGVLTINQLVAMTDDDLMKIRSLGALGRTEIRQTLREKGICE